jgi:hypothetical protein
VLRRIGNFDSLRGDVHRRGPCPFHEPAREKSRSFSVSLKKNPLSDSVLWIWGALDIAQLNKTESDVVSAAQQKTTST